MVRLSLFIMVTTISLVSCANNPSLAVLDGVGSEETRGMIQKSVILVPREKARRYDDPAWPSPIQVISPAKSAAKYEGYLFRTQDAERRIERMLVSNDKSICAQIEQTRDYTLYSNSYITIGDGGDNRVVCGSVIFEYGDLDKRNPFTNVSGIRFVSISEEFKNSLIQNYRIIIEYSDD